MGKEQNTGWEFINEEAEFRLKNPHHTSYLYFPLVNEAGMMSSVTPSLHGDIKTGQHTFFTRPVSVEDLHESRAARNFWVVIKGHVPWSATGNSAPQIAQRFDEQNADEVVLEAGILWHSVTRLHRPSGLQAKVLNFVPANDDKVELMEVTLSNTGATSLSLVPTAAIPIFGRSADRLRDHRHVTSLLHRSLIHRYGVLVQPTLTFDERGHLPNTTTYAVLGWTGDGTPPEGSFPDVESFIGEGGTLDWPAAIVDGGSRLERADQVVGYEAIGALRFPEAALAPGEAISYRLVFAILEDEASPEEVVDRYGGEGDFSTWLTHTKDFWTNKLQSVTIQTGDPDFDRWMKWVALQTALRRLFGNSFLPYHDYGRGGRGWRDLWQDILALLLTETDQVVETLLKNFAGVRIDGSNATIIGKQPGEFKADRNNIPRVWMDHGAWPLLTTQLFIDQTGDLEFLLKEQVYFQDHLVDRAQAVFQDWQPELGNQLRTRSGEVYRGTVFEHLLVQHLTVYFNAGDHNNALLEGGDWNDGIDMASHRGESVAFTALYAGNLRTLAQLASLLEERGHSHLALLEELGHLLAPVDDHDPQSKKARLKTYFDSCRGMVSGKRLSFSTAEIAAMLRARAEALTSHLQNREWISSDSGHKWFNGYYDDGGQRVEGDHPTGTRMTLSGQVFPLIGGIATSEQAHFILQAVDHFLHDLAIGGIRLNTDFQEVKHNLGRAFGFAFGHKENGAMFNHMTTMYAYGLYRYGLVREGYRVLNEMYQHSLNFPVSRMYPGLPEYFNARGRGMYPYLTGSASWYLLTLVTQAFGVRGLLGDLVLVPQLILEQFDEDGQAGLHALFAGRRILVTYDNPLGLDFDKYMIKKITLNGMPVRFEQHHNGARLGRAVITQLPLTQEHHLKLTLGPLLTD